MKQRIFIFLIALCSCAFVYAQGTLGEYPGAGPSIGFDSGCAYADAGTAPVATNDTGLAGTTCGAAWDVSTSPIFDNGTAGFDVPTGFFNYDVDVDAVYALRVQVFQQFGCCGYCVDQLLDLGQGEPCGTFGPQADLSAFGIVLDANGQALWGADVFGEPAGIIPYTDLCPNMEYFVSYQPLIGTGTGADYGFCQDNDAAGLWVNAGSAATATIVAPGTRDPIVINSASLAVSGAVDCGATDVLMDFAYDIAAGCTDAFGPRECSMGLEFQFRAVLADCPDPGVNLTIDSGPVVNNPTECFVSAAASGQILLSLADICAALECDPAAQLEIYTTYTACEADDIVGDGSGNDEASMMLGDLATLLADAEACCAPAVCESIYGFTGPAEVCSGAPIDFLVDAGCDVSLNTVDTGGGVGAYPSLVFDLYIYAPGGVPAQAACDGSYTVIPADIDGGASGNPDIIYLGSPDNAPGGGPFGTEGCGDLDALVSITNPTCAPITVTFFVVPYSTDLDSDGDGVFGGYLADSNPEACPIICQDVIINPIFEIITDEADGCNQFAGVFVSDGAGGFFDQDGDGALTTADACSSDILGPDCVDATTLDYDYTALDVGSCSGPLTGTLTCVCPSLECNSLPEPTPAEACAGAAFQVPVDMGGCITDPNFDVYPTDGTAGVSGWIAFYYVDATGAFVNCPAGSTGQDVLDNLNPPAGTAGFVFFGESNAAAGGGCTPVDIGAFTNPTCDPITIPICLLNGDVSNFVVAFDTDGDGANDLFCDVFETSVTVYPNLTATAITDEGATCGTLTAALFDANGNQCAGTEMMAMCAGEGDVPTISFPADASGFDCYPAQDVTGAACTACPACNIAPDMATNILCNDNGTPNDSTDDTYTFDILVNGSNTDPLATGTFNDNQGNAGIAYGTTLSYGPFSIAGGNITVNYTDVDDAACTAMMMATAPATCSVPVGACSITPDAAINIACDDAGTPGDPSDDTYTFDILVNGSNTNAGATGTFNDNQGNAGIAYGTTLSYGPFSIAGGNITVNYTDVDDAACTGMMTAVAPMTCSGATCSITPAAATNILCNDNGTPADPSDDTYTFDILVNGSSTFAGATNTFSDDQGNAGIAYGTTLSYGPFSISGGNTTVNFTDTETAACTGMMMATAPAPCSNAMCNISSSSTSMCDDNGTPEDDSDDITTYTITVTGSNTGAGFTASVAPDSGALTYGTALTYTVIGSGGLSVTFTDDTDITCTATFNQGSGCATIENIPTVGEWGLIILTLLMSITAIVGIRARREEEATA